MKSQPNVEYWEVAAKYWNDVVTVTPYWAWSTFYCERIPDEQLDILVMGVANGAFLLLLKEFKHKIWTCGIDFSFGMLKHAQKVEKKIVRCGGNVLPFKDESFDVILSDYFLTVIPEEILKETVKEMERVLKSDGLLLAKELRHRGHFVVWALASLFLGALLVISVVVFPVLSVFVFFLFVLAFLVYDPVNHKMGRSSAVSKFGLHVSTFVLKKRTFPTLKEMGELYFLSNKYLHIFTDREMDQLFSGSSFRIHDETTFLSWSFSLTGVKKKRVVKKAEQEVSE